MARVSIYSPQLTVPVQPAVMTNPADARAPYDAIAQGSERLMAAYEQSQKEDAAVFTALEMAKLRSKYNKRMLEDSTTGNVTDGYTQTINNDFDTDAADSVARAPNKYAQEALTVGYANQRVAVEGQAMGHEAEYRVVKKVTGVTELIDTLTEDTATFADAAKGFAVANTTIDGLGIDPAHKAALKQKSLQVMETFLNNQSLTNPQMVVDILKSGKAKGMIDPTKADTFMRSALSMIDHNESTARANDAMARAENYQAAKDTADNVQARLQTFGTEPTPQQLSVVASGLTPKGFEAWKSDLGQARAIYQATGNLSLKKTSDIGKVLKDNAPTKDTENLTDQQAAFAAVSEAADRELKFRFTNPVAAVSKSFADVGEAWAAFDTGQTPEALQTAIGKSLAAQDALEVPREIQRVLSVERAQQLAMTLNGATPEQTSARLSQIEAQFGPKYWNRAYKEMAKELTPIWRVVPIMHDAEARNKLISSSRVEKLKDVAGGVGVKKNLAADERFRDFAKSFASHPDGQSHITDVAEAAEVLALGEMMNGARDQSQAEDYALKKIISDNYVFTAPMGGVPIRVPKDKNINLRDLRAGAMVLREHVAATVKADRPIAPAGMRTADVKEQQVDSNVRNAYWITNGDETGIMLWGAQNAPITVGGKIIAYSFEDVANVARGYDPSSYLGAKGAGAPPPKPIIPKMMKDKVDELPNFSPPSENFTPTESSLPPSTAPKVVVFPKVK